MMTETRRHVPVFSNVIYHDNEHAQCCYHGHLKIQRILIYYLLILQNFECCVKDACAL